MSRIEVDDAVVRPLLARLAEWVRALGVDGVKGDRGDEVDLETVSPTLQNRYPVLFAESVLDVWPRDAGAIFRAAAMGSQVVIPGLWAGDQPGEWIGLQRAIRFAQSSAMSGFPTWGSDVGGYSAGNLTADVFMRWTQLGAISPVAMRRAVHAAGTEKHLAKADDPANQGNGLEVEALRRGPDDGRRRADEYGVAFPDLGLGNEPIEQADHTTSSREP